MILNNDGGFVMKEIEVMGSHAFCERMGLM
jgi:hypothetical protein